MAEKLDLSENSLGIVQVFKAYFHLFYSHCAHLFRVKGATDTPIGTTRDVDKVGIPRINVKRSVGGRRKSRAAEKVRYDETRGLVRQKKLTLQHLKRYLQLCEEKTRAF